MDSPLMVRANDVIAKTYKRFPVVLTRGSGCTLWDENGKRYTDFVAGIAVCNLGHAHPKIAEALADQARTLWHVSNLFYTVPQLELAEWLIAHSFADRVFFCNSGAEANEAAIKLARKYFKEAGQGHRFRIISMDQSFHGRTMATLSATGQEKVKHGFASAAGRASISCPSTMSTPSGTTIGPSTAAVMLEPIQGEGGVRCPAPDFLKRVRSICDEAGLLLIFDEIQTGMGRTGTLFAYEQFGDHARHHDPRQGAGQRSAHGRHARARSRWPPPSDRARTPRPSAARRSSRPRPGRSAGVIESEGILDRCRRTSDYFRSRLDVAQEPPCGHRGDAGAAACCSASSLPSRATALS